MVEAFRKTSLSGIAVLGLILAACAGPEGPQGVQGPTGEAGPAGPEGPAGTAGAGCTVTDNGDGTKTIACEDGTSVVVSDGQDVDPATVDDILAQLDKLSATEPESCATCHKGAGVKHQANYDRYSDASNLTMTIDSVVSEADGSGGFDSVMTFSITQGGLPFIDADGLPTLEQKRFMAVGYDASTSEFLDDEAYSNPVSLGNGQYQVTGTGFAFAPEQTDAIVYAYIADGPINVESGGHISLYDDVASAGLSFGAADQYDSVANSSGCSKCHGSPYMKHGYRASQVDNLAEFAACKACHYDNRNGSHIDWQMLVDDPARYAEIWNGADPTAAEQAKYAYTANVMNDVHMSHAMEFPYPQSMANCNTCHAGKLDRVLADENFTVETCKSCHPVDGSAEYGTASRALNTLLPTGHDLQMDCQSCHFEGNTAGRPTFRDIHSGYNKQIFTADGTRYTDIFSVTIDSASYDANSHVLNVKFHATEAADSTVAFDPADIVPTLMVGLYGYDTKDYIVSPHGRDADRNRLLEFAVDGTTTNPRFDVVSDANGSWDIDVDLSMWTDMIGNTVKRAEIAVMPDLRLIVGQKDDHTNGETDDTTFALNSVSRTFDLVDDAFDDGFYQDIVDVQGCNSCHNALGTTFHSPDRGGNIRVCRLCHVTSSGGSHLEMQSRSIDSYVHAIHSFQAFDPGDIDFSDPVQKMRYEMHIEHNYPEFTIMDCESCHYEGTYDVPDQSKSLPGILSGSDDVAGRNIGTVPAVVTGPATRACGGCHRAELINEDDANGLAAFYAHTKNGGYVVEDEPGVFEAIVQTIMSMFQ